MTNNQVDELGGRMADLVNSWATYHKLQPTFFTVDQVETIRISWIGDNDYLIVP